LLDCYTDGPGRTPFALKQHQPPSNRDDIHSSDPTAVLQCLRYCKVDM